jgi:hypothetical protein
MHDLLIYFFGALVGTFATLFAILSEARASHQQERDRDD